MSEVKGLREKQSYTWMERGVEHTIFIDKIEGNSILFRLDGKYNKYNRKQFAELIEDIGATPDYMAKGGKTEENMSVQFTDYKGKQIMFEPFFEKYYTNDIEFDSMEEAKKYIDSGSKKQSWQVSAYRTGMMAKGGKMADTKKETYYIDFLNKKKNFSMDRVTFDDYEKARKWAMKNFESFDPDMIKIKYADGGLLTGFNYSIGGL